LHLPPTTPLDRHLHLHRLEHDHDIAFVDLLTTAHSMRKIFPTSAR